MKVLISSAYLSTILKEVNPEITPVLHVSAAPDYICFHTEHGDPGTFVRADAEVIWSDYRAIQDGCRWDSVLKVVSKIPDQPILLKISDQKLELIFDYSE